MSDGRTHYFGDGCKPPHVWPTPSQAIANGACGVCLGGGETYDIILNRLGPCSGCGGSGSLDDMLARQCDDPNCPDHRGRTISVGHVHVLTEHGGKCVDDCPHPDHRD